MNIRKLMFLLLLLATSSVFAAGKTDHGRWLCQSCNLPPPLTSMTGEDLESEYAFIKGTVNSVDGSAWKPNDAVTLCDGSSCATLTFFVGCSCWLPQGGTVRDTGKGYRNAQDNRTPAPPASGSKGSPEQNGQGIFGWIHKVAVSFVDWLSGVPTTKTGTVIINQLSDAEAAGFQADYGSGFAFNADNTSLDWGGDFAFGGGDAFGGGGSQGSFCGGFLNRCTNL